MQSGFRFFVLIIMLSVMVTGVAAVSDEIKVGTPVNGNLTGSPDMYNLSAEADEVYSISLESSEFDTVLEIYNTDGTLIVNDDDSGAGSNSRIIIPVSKDKTFTIHVTSWGQASGAYILTVETISAVELGIGEPATVQTDGINPMYLTFSGESGEVINVFAISDEDDDTRLRIIDASTAKVIAEDDDSGESVNPFVRRLVLPNNGTYLVVVSPSFDNELSGSVTVTLEQTELLVLSDEPQTFILSTDSDTEIFHYEAEAGKSYTLNLNNLQQENMQIYVTMDDMQVSYANFDGVDEINMTFSPTADGTLTVTVSGFIFFDELEVEISVVTAQ